MTEAMRTAAEPEVVQDRYGVLVGWTHAPCGTGISVKVQSAASRADLNQGRIDSHHLLMTRNQALIFARYLLEATGQELGIERPHGWRKAWLRMRGR